MIIAKGGYHDIITSPRLYVCVSGVRNVSFSENYAYLLNEWSLNTQTVCRLCTPGLPAIITCRNWFVVEQNSTVITKRNWTVMLHLACIPVVYTSKRNNLRRLQWKLNSVIWWHICMWCSNKSKMTFRKTRK